MIKIYDILVMRFRLKKLRKQDEFLIKKRRYFDRKRRYFNKKDDILIKI